uniref:Ribonuclease S-7-like isoform X2 n=1 Tax=Cicer arietinum TaxID=3827 RepID=A0A1S3EDR4_CICAR|nr:ribonuclease S-7-like isoform X2 [Cicer arietinum]XP_012573091.1 ribonuclease S-7-like isoform X2 [Cicer arietinum]XP_012573092.1 ribonuclease S-7-like isoform X2 [Cicer arietinum]XP_027191155.1 ribonuclease S-7-like isoform X2 [Cicer arietinum]XP_027191156.1 ribonuclease S-7-like isoform X2 [Cicer arietinum]
MLLVVLVLNVNQVCINRMCTLKTLPKLFTIHGLWGTNVSQPYPLYCSGKGNRRILKGSLGTLEPQLIKEWPDVINQNDLDFWSYEWNKHGTCSMNKFPQLDYFQLALTIKARINLTDVLRQVGVIPHKTTPHNINTIVTAIKSANNNNNPVLVCTSGTTIPYLKEIRLCLYDNGTTYRNCPPPLFSGCYNKNFVLLP